jgi:hypothetical protein
MIATIFATAVLVLAVTAPVHAACAWVLWLDSDYLEGKRLEKTWHIVSASTGREECNAARQERLARLKRMHAGRIQQIEPDTVTVTWSEGTSTTFRPVCLPDSIDPRGPKGGAR